MGIADRDYIRESPRRSGLGPMNTWSVTVWLIAVCTVVFALDRILFSFGIRSVTPFVDESTGRIVNIADYVLTHAGHFSVDDAIFRFQVWRFITCQFLHGSMQHLLFNMIGLYFFGTLIETYLGRRRYLVFYLLSGIGGCLMFVALRWFHLLGYDLNVSLIGASAGIFGVLIATAVVAPRVTVLVMFIIPMKIRTAALLILGIAVYTVLAHGKAGDHNAGGEAAHLGGAIVGFLLIQRPSSIPALRMPSFKRSNMRYRP